MGSSQSSLSTSTSVSPTIEKKGNCIFEYNGDQPINDLKDKIDLSKIIIEAQFVIRPIIKNSLGLFSHWAMLFNQEDNLVTIEYGPNGVVIKGYLKNDYHNAYCGLMGDSAKVFWKEIEDYTEYTLRYVFMQLEEVINDMGYNKYSYDVKKKSCQNFIHSLSEDLVSSIDFSWVYPLEFDYKIKGSIQKLMGLNTFTYVPNIYFPNPVPQWLAYSGHTLAEQKKMLLEHDFDFDEKHFEEFTIAIG